MGYNWEKIFKEKDEKELLRIYAGKSLLDYEAGIYAGLELKKRNFDFKKIEKIHKEKIARLNADIVEYKELKYINSKYFRNQVLEGIGLVGFLILLLSNKNELESTNGYSIYRILLFIAASLVAIALAKWNYNRFKRNKKAIIERKIKLVKMFSASDV